MSGLDYDQLLELIVAVSMGSEARSMGVTNAALMAELRRRYPTEAALRSMWARVQQRIAGGQLPDGDMG